MNKVFKVIWSEARNAYVVVSEIAKNHGSKSCSTKKLLAMLIATGVMTCASMAPAMAADPPAEALKHSTVTNGDNITVTEGLNKDGGKEYNVALNNDIYLAGDDPDALVSISGSKGTIWATGSVTVGSGVDGSVVMDGTTATVSGLGNTTTAYDGFANGKGKAATEEQLKEISEVAENANQGWNLSTNGGEASKVAPGETVDFSGDQNINISNDGTNVKVELKNDIYLAGDDPNAFVNISGSKGTIWASGGVTAGSVAAGDVFMDGATATVSGLSNKTTAYDEFANGKGKAATEEQLKEVATEAGKHTTVTDGANITVTEDLNADGGKEYKVALNNDIFLSGDNDAFVDISGSKGTIWASSSVAAGNVVMDGASATVSGLSNQTTAYDGFANGKGKAATEEQLKEISKVADNANQGWNLSTNGDAASKVAPGETVDFSGDKNISVSNNGKDVKVELNKDIDVNSVQTNFVQTNALNAKYNLSVGTANENGTVPFFVNSNGAFYAANGKLVVDKDGKLVAHEAELGKVTADEGVIGNVVLKDGVFYKNSALRDGELFIGDADGNYSQITTKGAKLGKVTVAEDGKISGVAAGAVTADSTDAVNGSQLHAVATEAGKHSKVVNGSNINVEETDVDGQKNYKVNLNKDIILGDLTGKNVNISGTNGTIETTGYIATKDRVYADKGAKLADIDVTGNKISNGASSIVLDGSNVKVNDKVNIDQNGKVTGVADGDVKENSKDAVNGSQLYKTNQDVANNTNRINKLGSRVNKVGAGAAALAALHPMDFDPDDKLTFSAGYGNYAGENAAAIGAYYRPDEKVMFSVAGTVGNGENMVNAGVSFALDRTNHVSNSRTALAREVIDLRGQLAVMGAKMAKMEKAFGMLDETKTKLFPDVPANHWAYEYIAKLAGNGYIEGYPDGNFGGDRLMTRYEFAAMLYRAIENGAALEEKIIKEFEPELGRIRVDRISGEDGDRDKIERVRVNDTKGERDHYGNKLAK